MIEFRELNLVEPFPNLLPKMDIVFLRNVLIYFSPETKTEILKKVHAVMHKDSYLFLGGSETTMNLNVRFEREQIAPPFVIVPLFNDIYSHSHTKRYNHASSSH